jgi:2-keto-4-pentenoate hydratase/2-oxohepta-3-ene-1,7-dioic acid hydratase in catechol pathway
MKIAGFATARGTRLGVVEGDSIVDVQAVDARLPNDLGRWLDAYGCELDPLVVIARNAPASARRALHEVKLALPVARPGKVVCVGLNYFEHAREGGHPPPQFPTLFLRSLTSLVAHGSAILRPRASDTLDYEAELVAIIGRKAKHLARADALAAVAGYACFNDGSIRAYQRRGTQWGKNFDRTGGFGPWMVTADALPPGAAGLAIESRLNGRVLQSDNTRNMIFSVAELIAELTQAMTLEPGDLVVTGTPAGVGQSRNPPLWMRAGDTCEVIIEGIGVLTNPIADA